LIPIGIGLLPERCVVLAAFSQLVNKTKSNTGFPNLGSYKTNISEVQEVNVVFAPINTANGGFLD
jgi:hypothetical protein